MIHSKRKGNAFERQICDIFRSRFNDKFSRVPSSGAIATAQKEELSSEAKVMLSGDIIVPKNFRFSIECKSRREFSLWELIGDAKAIEWQEWFKQATQDASRSHKEPLVIVKYNNRQILAIMSEQFLSEFRNDKVKYIQYDKMIVCLLNKMLKFDRSFFYK